MYHCKIIYFLSKEVLVSSIQCGQMDTSHFKGRKKFGDLEGNS